MQTSRFHDALPESNSVIREVIERGITPVIQFSGYPDVATLERVDDLCARFGAELEIRFFGFRWLEFDTSALRHLPNVANLSIDTIRAISDFAPVAELQNLTRLRFGVHEHPDGRFLQQLDLARFTRLTLAENKRRNFDLSALSAANSLEHLFVQGHHRGIEAISALPRLTEVSLSGFPGRHDLAFLNLLGSLRSLFLILGSRRSIAEFTQPRLSKLKIVWVRELEELGPLQRFESLEELQIEDQLRLTSLDVSGLKLRRLTVSNCKRLAQISGLENQELTQLSVHGTAIPRASLNLSP